MGMAQLSKNPNQLTRSENLRIEEAVAELNAEFEYLRQRLRKHVEEADTTGAEYTAILMANAMSQIAVMQGAQRGDPKVISSMRQKGLLLLRLVPSVFSKRAASRKGCGVLSAIRFCPATL